VLSNESAAFAWITSCGGAETTLLCGFSVRHFYLHPFLPDSAGTIRLRPCMNIVTKALKWYSGLLAFSLIWLFFQKRLAWTLLGSSNPFTLGKDLVIGVALALGLVFFSLFASRHFLWAKLLEEEFLRILTPLSFRKIFFLGLSSGIAEELFFRGALLGGTGLYFSSFLFGLAHLIPRRELIPWAFYASLVGFIFGCVVEIRHTLLPVILAHSLMNILLIQLLNRRGTGG